jgi:hypothetical protein
MSESNTPESTPSTPTNLVKKFLSGYDKELEQALCAEATVLASLDRKKTSAIDVYAIVKKIENIINDYLMFKFQQGVQAQDLKDVITVRDLCLTLNRANGSDEWMRNVGQLIYRLKLIINLRLS